MKTNLSRKKTSTLKHKPDEWEALLQRHKYWKTLRVTAWALRFLNNSLARRQKATKLTGPLTPEEMVNAKTHWIKKVQSSTSPNLQTPGWELVKDNTTILRCSGRISRYNPIYIEGGLFGEKLNAHTHEQIMHLGVANTMANIRNEWWIPRLRSKVKKVTIAKYSAQSPMDPQRQLQCRGFGRRKGGRLKQLE